MRNKPKTAEKMPASKMCSILALDIGGTKLAGAAFDHRNNILAYARVATRAEQGPDAVVARLVRMARSLMERAGGPEDAPCAVGVGCGGPLDSETGIIYSPPNLPGWNAFPLKDRLEEHLGIQTFVDNDANAAAMAEHRFGAGRNRRNIFYITISTGIGAGLILDGEVYRGTNSSAGEFGHIVMKRNGPRCNCGGRGCLEALASGTAIARRARKEAAKHPDSRLSEILSTKGAISAKDVADAARADDSAALKIIHDAATYLGLGITSAIHLLNPEIVILGGGLSRAGKLLFEPIRRTVRERAQKHLAEFVPILPAELGGKTGIYGALAVALDRISSSSTSPCARDA